MANGGYTGALPARDDSPEAYSGVWESQEQYAELAAGRWAQQAAGLALRSVRFNSADSSRFTRTVRTAGNRRTWTWSGWVKRTALGSNQLLFGSSSLWTELFFNSSNQLQVYAEGGSIPAGGIYLYSNAVFRDTSAWMHVVWVLDTTQPTAANRLRVYVNGQQITWTTSVSFDQNLDFNVNSANVHGIGSRVAENNLYLNAYLASVYFIDGQALEPEAFGFFDGSGVWQPRPFKGQYANRTGPVYSNGVTGSYTSGWTAGLGPDVLFNGDLNTLTDQVDSGPTGVPGYLYWTPATPIPVTSSLRIYGRWYTSSIGNPYLVSDEVSINGNPYVAPGNGTTANQWANLSSYLSTYSITTITNITWRSNPTAANRLDPAMGAIEVDGNILVEPSTGRNSFYLDFSDNSATTATALGADRSGNQNNWSPTNFAVAPAAWYKDANFAVGTQTGGTDLPATAMFDGNLASAWGAGRGPGTLKWVLTNAVSIPAGTLEVNAFGGPGDYQGYWYVTVKNAAGTTLTSQNITSNTAAWYSLGSGLGNIKEIWLTFDGGWNPGAAYAGGAIHEFRIGSQVLVWNDNFTFNDSLLDSPVNGRQSDTGLGGQVQGNYATLNPLQILGTLSNGNLDASVNDGVAYSTIAMSSGKWYFEMTAGSTGGHYAGIYATTGLPAVNTATSYAYACPNNSTIGIAVDITNGYIWYAINGVWQASGNPATGANPNPPSASNTPNTATIQANQWVFSVQSGSGANTTVVNFGARAFSYQAPSGFKALCTANLPEPAVKRGDDYFQTLLYTGNGSTQTLKGLRFSPDLVWTKARNAANSHGWWDTVRGVQKRLISDLPNGESTRTGGLTAFTADGFTHGDDGTGNDANVNFVAWAWKAGNATTTLNPGDAGAGSLASTFRANPQAGFSIVSYVGNGTGGATVAHGLGKAPKFVVFKCRDNSYDWLTYHGSLPNTTMLALNTTGNPHATGRGDFLNSTNPSSSLLTLGSTVGVNESGSRFIAYCFAEIESFSSIGSYVGTGSSNGPFCWTGMRPKWLLIKAATAGESYPSWRLFDTSRSPYNAARLELYPNLSIIEDGGNTPFDILSNGFKARVDATWNTSGVTYVYIAFAEHPFRSARAR